MMHGHLNVKFAGIIFDRAKPSFWRKKPAQFYLVNYILHKDCPGTETGSRVANRAAKGV